MAQSEQLSLSWDAHQKNICRGLSVLQQRGEFVDMTLAADGHHVKVHQMVMSLVSPYIKDLISTAQCPHPIIFLNNISYTVLCSILEYVYTGEVLVPKERLEDLIAAGKALHIKGLREMEKTQPSDSPTPQASPKKPTNISKMLKAHRDKKTAESTEAIAAPQPIHKIYLNEENDTEQDDMTMETQDDSTDVRDSTMDNSNETQNTPDSSNKKGMVFNDTPDESRKALMKSKVQYTLSNQGGLLTIYNRYVYRLQYVSKKNKQRRWRCINYNSAQCRAHIFTNENDMVTERFLYVDLLTSVLNTAQWDFTHDLRTGLSVNQKLQYSVSNQGGLQVIHNRFIYHLRYFRKTNRNKFWRCVDYQSSYKCPANICTGEYDQITERSFTHNHPFHDSKILKKFRNGGIYAMYQEAENKAESKKKERRVPTNKTDSE